MPRPRHILIALLVLGLTAPTALGGTRPVIDTDTFAGAAWLFEKPKGLTGYLAVAFDHRSATDERPFALAMVGKGPCKEKKHGPVCHIREGGMWDLREGEFEVDHLAGSASLEVRRGSFESSMLWSGVGQAQPFASETWSTYPDFVYFAHGTHLAQEATIAGNIGRRSLGAQGLTSTPVFATSVYTGVQYVEGETVRYGGVTWRF